MSIWWYLFIACCVLASFPVTVPLSIWVAFKFTHGRCKAKEAKRA